MDDEFFLQLQAEDRAIDRITAELGHDTEQALRAAFQAGQEYERERWEAQTIEQGVGPIVDQITQEGDR